MNFKSKQQTAATQSPIHPNPITVKEACRLLACGRTFLFGLRKSGELLPVMMGNHRIRYHEHEVRDWLASRPRKMLGAPAIKPIAAPYRRAGGENGGEKPSAAPAKNEKAA